MLSYTHLPEATTSQGHNRPFHDTEDGALWARIVISGIVLALFTQETARVQNTENSRGRTAFIAVLKCLDNEVARWNNAVCTRVNAKVTKIVSYISKKGKQNNFARFCCSVIEMRVPVLSCMYFSGNTAPQGNNKNFPKESSIQNALSSGNEVKTPVIDANRHFPEESGTQHAMLSSGKEVETTVIDLIRKQTSYLNVAAVIMPFLAALFLNRKNEVPQALTD